MENVNHVTIAGHLVKSAELRYTSTGKAVASFVVAANKKISEDKQIVAYIPVNAWNQAEELGALVKGDAVLVTGELRTGSYEKNGRLFTHGMCKHQMLWWRHLLIIKEMETETLIHS